VARCAPAAGSGGSVRDVEQRVDRYRGTEQLALEHGAGIEFK